MSEGRGHLREEKEEGPPRLLSALPEGAKRNRKIVGRQRKGFAKASIYKGFPEGLEIKECVEQVFFVENSVGSVSNRARRIEHNSSPSSHYAAKSPPLLITDLKGERREVPTYNVRKRPYTAVHKKTKPDLAQNNRGIKKGEKRREIPVMPFSASVDP